jgi:uncharacterized Fe-S cluster-containing radical SAM superfamily enzyme
MGVRLTVAVGASVGSISGVGCGVGEADRVGETAVAATVATCRVTVALSAVSDGVQAASAKKSNLINQSFQKHACNGFISLSTILNPLHIQNHKSIGEKGLLIINVSVTSNEDNHTKSIRPYKDYYTVN